MWSHPKRAEYEISTEKKNQYWEKSEEGPQPAQVLPRCTTHQLLVYTDHRNGPLFCGFNMHMG